MIGIILRVVAFILFLVAGFNQTLFGQGELDLIAFALACWVVAALVGGYGPPWPGNR